MWNVSSDFNDGRCSTGGWQSYYNILWPAFEICGCSCVLIPKQLLDTRSLKIWKVTIAHIFVQAADQKTWIQAKSFSIHVSNVKCALSCVKFQISLIKFQSHNYVKYSQSCAEDDIYNFLWTIRNCNMVAWWNFVSFILLKIKTISINEYVRLGYICRTVPVYAWDNHVGYY